MRKLTILREKKIAACAAKLKVYIEDVESNEIVINNYRCRLLGEIKNGEEVTFEIGNESAKIFVIADKLSKNFCSEYYQLPEGEEDISLKGRNEFNPATGNAFRFYNNPSAGIEEHRKNGKLKGILVLVIALIVGAIFGRVVATVLLNGIGKDKTFTSHGVSITLTEKFGETEVFSQTVAYQSKDVAVFMLKESFDLFPDAENYSLEQYAKMVISLNHKETDGVKTKDGLTYFEYDYLDVANDRVNHYFAYVFKSDDAFWLVQFALLEKNVEKYDEHIEKWAKSVKFEN